MAIRLRRHSALFVVVLALSMAAGLGSSVSGQEGQSVGQAAVEAATRSGEHLFIFFYKQDDADTRSMLGIFREAVQQMPTPVGSVVIRISDAQEKELVAHYGVSRAPMPLVLAVAPNGAVTKAFPVRFTKHELQQGLVSPATAQCMRALQQQKLVVLVVQNQQTRAGQMAYRGATDFQRDARFAKATEVVTIDPANAAETRFLQSLKVNPKTKDAVTVLLAPPGKPIATFTGAASKEQIVAKVTAAQSGCCPGGQCGPGGCCPTGNANR